MKLDREKFNFLRKQAGFSLIQLMIAIPLGLLVMLSVMQIYTGSMQSMHLQNSYSRVQENGRMATELMIRDIRGADFWGCVGDINDIRDNLDSADPDYDADILPFAGGIDGANDVAAKTIDSIDVMDGSDVLTLRSAVSLFDVKVVAPYMGTKSAAINVSAGSRLVVGDLLLISDCSKADLFSNTSDTKTNDIIGHNTDVLPNAVKNITSELTDPYDGSAQILIPSTKTYFIGINPEGNGSLYRADNGIAKELVRGIVAMQLKYGEDTSGDGSVNTFLDVPADMNNVLSIKVSLSAENGEDAMGTGLIREYQVTANIRNRTLR